MVEWPWRHDSRRRVRVSVKRCSFVRGAQGARGRGRERVRERGGVEDGWEVCLEEVCRFVDAAVEDVVADFCK